MTYDDLTVLIPCHSLEDFPTELNEEQSAGLLNAFAVLCHPVLLANANCLPRWERADESGEARPNRLIVIPSACDGWVPHGWADEARRAGSTVINGISERKELLRACLEPLEDTPAHDPELAGDFMALGSCMLQIELLTRHMRNFSNLDEVRLQREAVAAAKAALEDDALAVETHLRTCFEMLLEARERFYPVDCYLIDLCLVIPRLADEHLQRLAAGTVPVNFLATAEDWSKLHGDAGEAVQLIRDGLQQKRIDLIGGEWRETAGPLMSIQSVIAELQRGLAAYEEIFGTRPQTFARRRFGLGPAYPQVLSHCGMSSALHLVLDDGLYPDEEHSKIRWEGGDGTVIDALSRIPLAGDSAASFLRFPVRMAESMDHDQTACVVFARWPELKSPWLEDFRRSQRYSRALGKFVTFAEFFQAADVPGRIVEFKAGDYLSPFLVQSVAREQPSPISRYVDYWRRHLRFEALEWCRNLAEILKTGTVAAAAHAERERVIEDADPDATDDAQGTAADQQLDQLSEEVARTLPPLFGAGSGDRPGVLVVNPLSFDRRIPVAWPETLEAPALGNGVAAVQIDDGHHEVLADVPGCGFLWVPAGGAAPAPPSKVPTAEPLLLRNEFFEVNLSEVTGGIGQIRTYYRSPNRLSEQVAFRFPREKVYRLGEGDKAEEHRTYYSVMRMRDSRVLCDGPSLGEIETTGEIIDPERREVLADYRQVTRVRRGKPAVEIELELDVAKLPEGDPWTNYIAARFAWKNESVVLTQSVHQGAYPVSSERIESPHFLEIADEEFRTTIIPFGLPFHRKTGPRMLDTLLITAGETQRKFRFEIRVDEMYPLQSALDAMSPVIQFEASGQATPTSGWLFHLSAPNVQLMRILPTPPKDADDAPTGWTVRLMETEGRRKATKLHCFRPPTSARQINAAGQSLRTLTIEDGAVLIDMTPHELCDVALSFDEPAAD